MKKYLVVYHANIDALKQMQSSTPEESKKGMEQWMQWAQKCGDNLIDLGNPLGMGQKLSPDSSEPSTRQVCGYSILQATDMDHAKDLLQGHPHLGWDGGCEIEVHEALPLPS